MKSRKKKYEQVQIQFPLRMPPVLIEAVEATADAMDVSPAQVVRMSVESFLYGDHRKLTINEFMEEK